MKNHYFEKAVFIDALQLVLVSVANGLLVGSVLIMLVIVLSGSAGASTPAFSRF
jgi:hypothetical protein